MVSPGTREEREARLWEEFSSVSQKEAADRNRGFLGLLVVVVILFSALDLMLDPIQGAALWMRLAMNCAIVGALGAVAIGLGYSWVRRQVYAFLFMLCVLVSASRAFPLDGVSLTAGRMAFHYLTTLGLTIIVIQWSWGWQLALGAALLSLFAAAVPPNDPDLSFFVVYLGGGALFTAGLAIVLVNWRFAKYVAERHLREANRWMTEQATRLQAKNEELSDFFMVLSHDLRAPLINLEGFAREIGENIEAMDGLVGADGAGGEAEIERRRRAWTDLKSEIHDSTGFIRRSVSRIAVLVDGLLELSRLDPAVQAIEPVDLNRLVKDILDSLDCQLAGRRIEVEVGDLPTIAGDRVLLTRVFSNLLDNAVKYMKPAGEARIEVACVPAGDEYRITIRDTGLGIPKEQVEHIFRLFHRLEVGDVPGEGMGLVAAKKIIEGHGGTIQVESEWGRGTAFHFTLPRVWRATASGSGAEALA